MAKLIIQLKNQISSNVLQNYYETTRYIKKRVIKIVRHNLRIGNGTYVQTRIVAFVKNYYYVEKCLVPVTVICYRCCVNLLSDDYKSMAKLLCNLFIIIYGEPGTTL